MNELLTKVLEAHGGLERWRTYNKVEATIVSGGGFFALKGVLQDANPRRMTVWLHEERSSVMPYGAPDQRTMFTPERITIEKLDGTLVAERLAPRDSFAGTRCTPLGTLCIAPTSTAKRYGPTSRRPLPLRWMASASRRLRPGKRGRRPGGCCVSIFLA